MAHRQVPALLQSEKGNRPLKKSELDCRFKAVAGMGAQVSIALRKAAQVLVVAYVAVSLTFNFQIRTGEGAA